MVRHLTLPKEGESASGDAALVRHEGSRTLLAVVDALGHGPHAAEVADAAIAYLGSLSLDLRVGEAMSSLDRHLHGSRGAAVLLCRIEDAALHMCSVGNVEVRGVRAPLPLLLTAGVVGSGRLPRLRVLEQDMLERQRFLAFTDGVSARFDLAQAAEQDALDLCHKLLERHRRSHDDATMMVVDLERSE